MVEIFLDHAACGSKEEAIVIVDVILEEIQQRDLQLYSPECLEILIGCLLENLDLSDRQEARVLATQIKNELTKDLCENEQEGSSVGSNKEPDNRIHHGSMEGNDDDDEDEDDDEENAPLFEGECELCDRYIQLTKHHLIPKSTWPRMEVKLMHVADAIERGDLDKAGMLLGPGLIHLIEDLQQQNQLDKQCIRQILHRTCDICRPCHSALHKTHENMELALWHSTIDLILQDKQMASYCKWASKQRSGKYSIHHKKKYP